MRSTARSPHAQKVGPLVHRQRKQPANLVDERPLALFLQRVFLRPLTIYLFLAHQELVIG
jgi:hypothetical protein